MTDRQRIEAIHTELRRLRGEMEGTLVLLRRETYAQGTPTDQRHRLSETVGVLWEVVRDLSSLEAYTNGN